MADPHASEHPYVFDPDDYPDDHDDEDPGYDCGRWSNGRLTRSCSRAGTEWCDFECPNRNSLYGSHD